MNMSKSNYEKLRVVHGGSWIDDRDDCRAAFRDRYEPDGRFDDFGFRLVITKRTHVHE